MGKVFNLNGKTKEDMAECDMYSDQLSDLFTEFGKVFFEKDDLKKEIQKGIFNDEIVPKNMEFFEAKLKKTGTGFLICNSF